MYSLANKNSGFKSSPSVCIPQMRYIYEQSKLNQPI